MENSKYSVNSLVSELTKSKHGKYLEYENEVKKAAEYDPAFLAHLITWNLIHGDVRDSKVAIPVLSLRYLRDDELRESSIASLLTLDPRNLVKAYRLNKEITDSRVVGKSKVRAVHGRPIVGSRHQLDFGLKRYLAVQEESPARWVRTAVQHRASLKELYAVSHFSPNDLAQKVLFAGKYPKNSVFHAIAHLRDMTPAEAAGAILKHKIPFQIAIGALGLKKEEYIKNTDYALAFIGLMSGQQLLNNTKFLTTIGVFNNSMLLSEYQKAIQKAGTDKKTSALKAGKVIEAVKDLDPHIVEKLTRLQDKKIEETTNLEGDWLILGDRSGSLRESIELTKMIADVMAKSVKGNVYLIFFNTQPSFFDITGKSLEEIKQMTRLIDASGGTSCGCGIEFLRMKRLSVNGIAIVSDGGDRGTPSFTESYKRYCEMLDVEPSVYFFKVPGSDPDWLSEPCKQSGIPIERYDMSSQADYYSIPNIVKLMKTGRFQLLDEIMSTPLLKITDVLPYSMIATFKIKKESVL